MLRTRILAAATATLLALGMAAGGASAATAAPPQEDTKVWVCKYSGTPGVNEKYKEGKNPIEVSVTTIANNSGFDPVTGEGYFADGQARSFSLGYSDTFDVPPTIEDCPRPVLPIPGYEVTDQTCLAGGSITLDESEWIIYVVTDSSGTVIPNDQLTDLAPGTYTVTPTAVPPAILDDEFYDPVAVIDAVDPALCAELATGDVSITPATCELGESLDESGIDAIGATFEVIDNGSTDGSYEVLFTAEEGYLFAGGLETLTVTGELAGPNSELCLEATGSVPLIDPTCELGASVDLANISGVNATYEVIDDGSTDGSYEVLFTASAGYRFAGNQQTLTVSGDLAERDPELCLEATGSVPLIDPTCELGASVDLENISGVNATFEVIDDGSESGSYEVEFTALEGFRFAGDQTTLTVSGELADRDPELCLEPTYVAPLIDATCELGESLDVEGIDAENATWEVIDDGSVSGTYEIEFTADEGYRFAGDEQTLTVTGELAGPNTELCLEAIAAIAVSDADCFLDSTFDEDGFTAENSTYEITVYNAETREYEVVFTAEYGYRFDTSLSGVS